MYDGPSAPDNLKTAQIVVLFASHCKFISLLSNSDKRYWSGFNYKIKRIPAFGLKLSLQM